MGQTGQSKASEGHASSRHCVGTRSQEAEPRSSAPLVAFGLVSQRWALCLLVALGMWACTVTVDKPPSTQDTEDDRSDDSAEDSELEPECDVLTGCAQGWCVDGQCLEVECVRDEHCASGERCVAQRCVANSEQCSTSSCSAHGDCDDSSGEVVCACDEGWGGSACDACAEGFAPDEQGQCVAQAPCGGLGDEYCNGRGSCAESGGVFVCSCRDGWAGERCGRCETDYVQWGAVCLPPSHEPCNGLDDDIDGEIDEFCQCELDAVQACYPAAHEPPEGCEYGEQRCGQGGWSGCEGAKVPPIGALKCCRIFDDEQNPAHEVLDQCLLTYPPAAIPQCMELAGWTPDVPSCVFSHVNVSVADEFVDKSRGGMRVENLVAGREYTRGVAMADFGVLEEDVLHETFSAVEIEGTTGCAPGGRGFAWGSILYRSADDGVGELVYGYVGICKDNCDAEAYLRSAEPIQVCADGFLPPN